MTKNNNPRVERIKKVGQPDAKLWIPNKDKEICFASPAFGTNTYRGVGKEILSRRLAVPTGEDNALLLHASYCSTAKDEPEYANVRDHMKQRWLWTFNRNLWTSEGLYVVTDPKSKGLSEELSQEDLEKALKGGKELAWGGIRFSKDERVRFAPIGSYELGEHTPEQLSNQGDVVANYGVEGAEMLGKVASTFIRYKSYTFGVDVNKGSKPELRVASLDSYDGGDRLFVIGDGWYDDGNNGYAFGVCE